MSRRFLFLLLAAGIGTGWAAAGEPAGPKKATAPKSVAEQAARLVAELGSDDFDTRARAARQLEALGPAVGPALQKAAASRDPEVRRLVLQVAERLARRMEAAEVLEPRRLRVAYRDVPLNIAVNDFMRVSGARIQLEGVKADRKITVDTGYTTFWEAFDKFCAAAGLVEKIYDTPANQDVQEGYPNGWARRRMMMWNARGGQVQEEIIPALLNGQFVLTEAKAAPRPTHQSGAVRFRALPAGTTLGKFSTFKGDKELIFGLEILPEPALAWERVQSLHVTKAVDDQGQNLEVSAASAGDPPPMDEDGMVFWDGDYGPNGPANNGGQRLPLRLTLGRKPSAVLKELSGVVTIKLQTGTQTIATIDRVLDARDKSVKGSDGSFLKVVEVKREEGGKLVIHVKVDQAQTEEAPNPWGWRGMGWRGNLGGNGGEGAVDSSVSTGNLVLYDARGHLVRLVSKEQIPDENGLIEEYNFTYQPVRGQPEPRKLVLEGRRPVSIDVPFTLRDVPLKPVPGAPKSSPPPAQRGGGGPFAPPAVEG